ncbi:MAG: MupG family TIM beta-alpha barrel fold protein [Lachnospiraceae bacterium]|nr:MupG family TIM beta-alpha barrel fold protein [Lachnospiraceae bacterium]
MKTGVSIYLSSGMEFNEKVLEKAKKAGVKYGFTSMHIPEEDGDDYKDRAICLLQKCREADLSLTIDVDPSTPEKLGLKRMEDLLDLGVKSLRLDFGFSDEDVVRLAKEFRLVWNASTVSFSDVISWEKMGVDISEFKACHNYYPKRYTGLSIEKVDKINERLKLNGFTTEAFVPGNTSLRGPLHEGLPTVEEHRDRDDVLLNMLELYDANTDIVYIGDCDIKDSDWERVADLSKGFVRLKVQNLDIAELKDKLQHDRPDSSEYVIRSCESRLWDISYDLKQKNTIDCETGYICIANEGYLRYKGELEICRKPRKRDERVNVIGHVEKEDLKYLPYIKDGMGFMLI